MLGKHNARFQNRPELFTDTYLSSVSNTGQRQPIDKNVYKAIKQNNVNYLVDKEQQNAVEKAENYDQQKELTDAIIRLRKKYDDTKIETAKKQRYLQNMQEERQKLQEIITKMSQEKKLAQKETQEFDDKLQNREKELEYLEYTRDVKLHLQQRLKEDIRYYKKHSFQENIKLVRLRTHLKQLKQKDTNRKHLTSKCKLVLQTLQQTVKMRENDRDIHLKQVQTVLMRKLQNTELKTNRQHELQNSMYKALTDKLPQQQVLCNKMYCELFLRKMLRNKMSSLMSQNKTIENAFNTIKKQTRISTASEFIDDYLALDSRYGELLESIGKAQKRISQQKDTQVSLQKQREKIEIQAAQIDELFERNSHRTNQNSKLEKKLNQYKDDKIRCDQLNLMLKRWSSKLINKLNGSQSNRSIKQIDEKIVKDSKLLQEQVIKALNLIMSTLKQKQVKQFETPPSKSEINTYASEEKINLRMLTQQSVLSKQYSRKNFRVRTMTAHEQVLQDRDNQYDELSQFDFLRANRRIVKKNNAKSLRARIKTKPF